ncbi:MULTISPECIES: GNAT family N-acetyltransferase [unclassified Bacillus (in: firmicutes)]|uniref:GNAT family N-acetyltransferase n=1 Tax=unclassified Bacillus (in: firmicutes) TaxID=185979 RepID=UPI0008F25D77|nr:MULTISPECIES: GNAT family N-acetyltransferase [unclassified Bacillus (in: firmicutes)]SFA78227.1 Predicted N-acyltransferase, GNAT family [Bacillus sp. UNCCL13]SFQ68156.1 Predicted N-acyltransferase, GNAT family [Bacillus sp. cl95]
MNVKAVTNPDQLEEAFAIRKTVFVEEQQVPMEEEIDEYENDCTHFVLYEEGKPIGAGRFRELDDYGKVERICVLKENRHGGSGKAIMEAIENFAVKEGFKKLKLNAQTQAIPFYEKLGYQAVSDEFLDAGIPHRTMIKTV